MRTGMKRIDKCDIQTIAVQTFDIQIGGVEGVVKIDADAVRNDAQSNIPRRSIPTVCN